METDRQPTSRRSKTIPERCPKCDFSVTINETEFFTTGVCENCKDFAQLEEIDQCCGKPDMQPVRFIDINGEENTVRRQCSRCGAMNRNAIGGYTSESRSKLPLIDVKKKERREEYLRKARASMWDYKKQGRDLLKIQEDEIWKENYDEYLQSDLWYIKRGLILDRDDHLCQSCLKEKATEVHHRTYQFVDFTGREPAYDLTSLCRGCHQFVHDKLKEMKSARDEKNKIESR